MPRGRVGSAGNHLSKWEVESWSILFLPATEGTNADPFVRMSLGELKEAKRRCNDVEVVEEEPQLPAANYVSTAFGLIILQSLLERKDLDNYVGEIRGLPYPVTKRIKDLR